MGQRAAEEITEDTALAEIIGHPGAMEVLAKYRLPCLHCPMAALEVGKLKIGEVARVYGIDEKNLIKELNEVIKIGEKGEV